jgi:hypothetical protein
MSFGSTGFGRALPTGSVIAAGEAVTIINGLLVVFDASTNKTRPLTLAINSTMRPLRISNGN